jgi:hypothetical protein
MPHLPTIFLSSTYYDLAQVRADIVTFVQEQLGSGEALSMAGSRGKGEGA